eukprot:CAMPEP_0115329520 /NCGR_PEP_ID=MMETSP0270-20121206/85274_1 /TAXON_ID=71861 /ORGANISM="Scrippsiella trochoidea, Strain CCMP3099" /LENGTH=98 /DNA_ID=CAMNT_0002750147 /DNA_START=648 /DNA_END=942 /DNA_ORIENTATION=+
MDEATAEDTQLQGSLATLEGTPHVALRHDLEAHLQLLSQTADGGPDISNTSAKLVIPFQLSPSGGWWTKQREPVQNSLSKPTGSPQGDKVALPDAEKT